MANYQTLTSDKNKNTALLLCLFGGLFGLHLFYVGKIGKGLLYLFTGGLFCIGWLMDIIAIATGSFKDNAGAPLRASQKDYNNNTTNQGVNVNVNIPQSQANANANANVDVADQLKKLAELRDNGTLTEEEFNAQKAKLLS